MLGLVLMAAFGTAVNAPGQVPKQDVVLLWNQALLEAIKAGHIPPPAAARHMAIVHAAIYDAVNAITQTHSPFYAKFAATGPAAPEAAAAIAGHRTLAALYPDQLPNFDAVLDDCMGTIPDGPAKANGATLGQAVADKILSWRSADGSTRKMSYHTPLVAGMWQPTPPDFRSALLPQWARMTCFAVPDPARLRPRPPPALNSPAYTAAFYEVLALGGANSTVRTTEQTEIAKFWADGEGTVTPPGHWNLIAQTVARARGNTLEANARLFALLNITMADAAVCCWECKYHYGFWRPVQAIPQADLDGNPDTQPDPCWTPLLTTPPFPTYTSGHSTFSSAAATVLANFFGSDLMCFTSDSDGLHGVRRSFRSFSSAAAEAGMSRIYGGIHWSFDNDEGLAAGRQLADYVTRNFLVPQGQAAPRITLLGPQ